MKSNWKRNKYTGYKVFCFIIVSTALLLPSPSAAFASLVTAIQKLTCFLIFGECTKVPIFTSSKDIFIHFILEKLWIASLKSILLRISDSLGDIQKFFLHPTVTTKTSLCYSAGDHFFLKINAPVR